MSEIAQADTYDSPNHRKYTSPSKVYAWHLRLVLNRIFELVASTNPKSVLDAGCGEGFVVDALKRRLPEVKFTGVDHSNAAIAYAKEHFSDSGFFRSGNLYKLPFSDRSFDTVLCLEVLEHLDDPSKALQELQRVSRGSVIIAVPLEPYFQWLNVLGQRLGVSLDPGHVNFWTKRGFQTFIRHHFAEPEFSWKHIYQFMVATV